MKLLAITLLTIAVMLGIISVTYAQTATPTATPRATSVPAGAPSTGYGGVS